MEVLSRAQWVALQATFAEAMQRLTIQIPGTHFLFLGEQGARRTADAIQQLALRTRQLDREIENHLKSRLP